MGKLFNLKSWLTLPDTTRYLSVLFDEEVTESDVLRLALDGHLCLSVHIVNRIVARAGKVVPIQEAVFNEVPSLDNLGSVRIYKGPTIYTDGVATHIVEFEIDIVELEGIYDLAMLGSEKTDVARRYHTLNGGPQIDSVNLVGAFISGGKGRLCQIQASLEDQQNISGSRATLEKLAAQFEAGDTDVDITESRLSRFKEDRKVFEQRFKPGSARYLPADLPEDTVLVVRTDALRELEKLYQDPPSQKILGHVSDKLALMNKAAGKFWANADRDDRGTHPENKTVEQWFVENAFSQTLAEKATTIIRPSWAAVGRKPEK
jgi:hypothetical protein